MFRSCLIVAWRSARRDWVYALLNIAALSLGCAAATLIWFFVHDEISYDRFLPDYQDVYRVQLTIAEAGQRPVTWPATPARLAAELKLDFPEIAVTTRAALQSLGLRHGQVEATENVEWVDVDFFRVLGYWLLRGDPATALAEPDSIVLSRTLAYKYFGTVDCLGQALEVNHLHSVRVTGVAEDVPTNATMRFVALLSGKTTWGRLATLDANPPSPGQLSVTVTTFVRLQPGVAINMIADRFPAFSLSHYPKADGSKPLYSALFINPLAELHLHPFNPDTNEREYRIQTVYAVSVTGLLILVLAGTNFVTLVTARATRRVTEVGVRKSVGALRSQLMAQFMCESICYAVISALLGTLLAALFLPSLNAVLNRQIHVDLWHQLSLVAAAIALSIPFGIAAGFYPAVILSRLPPALVMKGRPGALVKGGGAMRLSLVMCQSTATAALLIATLVIFRQNTFAMSSALGFDKDFVLTIDLNGLPEQDTADGLGKREAGPVEALRTQLAAVPGVEAIAATFIVPPVTKSLLQNFGLTDDVDRSPVSFNVQPIDFGYFDLYRIPLLAGRDFSRSLAEDKTAPDDKSRLTAVVINETAARALGLGTAQAAVGREVHSTSPEDPDRHYRVIGVVPDFPFDSIRNRVQPTIFVVDSDLFTVLSLRLSGSDLLRALHDIDGVWHEFVPQRPINRAFLDERIELLYLDITRQGRLFATLSGVAVAIGCLGLVGLSSYTTERRTKEIGVRKALGASAVDVAKLLIWQFLKPVLLANALAWPIAWWVMGSWLEGFAYHVQIGAFPFLMAGLGTVAITIATTACHVVQRARSRPVTALRYE